MRECRDIKILRSQLFQVNGRQRKGKEGILICSHCGDEQPGFKGAVNVEDETVFEVDSVVNLNNENTCAEDDGVQSAAHWLLNFNSNFE